MSKVTISSRFCLLCYKTVRSPNNTAKTAHNIKRFIKFVNRFTKQKQNLYELVEDHKLLECCKNCNCIIEDFCQNYNQLKILELRLDFMLDILVDKINYANKVPARWKHVTTVLEELLMADLEKKAENQDRIRKLRQNLIEAADQRKARTKPTILLNRCQNIQLRKPSSSQISTLPVIQPTTKYSNFGDIEIENGMEYSTECITASMAKHDDTTKSARITNLDEETEDDDLPELEDRRSDINYEIADWEDDANRDRETSNLMKMEGTAIFKDPQIQVKVEHQSLQAQGSEADYLGLNQAKALSIADNQQSRYSLRENRVTKFTDEFESDDDDHTKANEYNSADSPSNTVVSSSDEDLQMKAETPKLKRGYPKSKSTFSAKLDIECKICAKKFSSLLRKDHHFKYCHDFTRSKTGKLYPCKKGGCTAYFLTSMQVSRHRRFDHGKSLRQKREEKGKQFECPKCSKRFYLKSALNKHLEYHKDPKEWRHECEICGKKFVIKFRLQEHSRLHTNDKPYDCRFCEKRFSNYFGLNKHLITKHRDEDFNKDELINETLIEKSKGGEMKRPQGVKSVSTADLGEGFDEVEKVHKNMGESEGKKINMKVSSVLDEDYLLARNGNCFGDERLVELEDLD